MSRSSLAVLTVFFASGGLWLTASTPSSASSASPVSDDQAGQMAFDVQMSQLLQQGMAGDAASLKKIVTSCDARLTTQPQDDLATAWKGTAVVMQGVAHFQAGNWQDGLKVWPRGMKMLEDVNARSESPFVRYQVASVYLSSWTHEQQPERKKQVATVGAEAFAAIQQTPVLDRKPVALRVRLMGQAAAAYTYLEQPKRATTLYQSIIQLAPDSSEAKAAREQLDGKPMAAAAPEVPQPGQRFDHLVREDFFNGMFNDDAEAFDRALQLCESTLRAHPDHYEAMVWLGSGRLHQSGQISAEQPQLATALWAEGLQLMHTACAMDPDNISVLIPRAATLVQIGRSVPLSDNERLTLLNLAVYDYERTLQIQKPYFDTLSPHARAELLFGLGDGWHQLKNSQRANRYFERVIADDPDSEQAELSRLFIKGELDAAALKNRNCAGCHG